MHTVRNETLLQKVSNAIKDYRFSLHRTTLWKMQRQLPRRFTIIGTVHYDPDTAAEVDYMPPGFFDGPDLPELSIVVAEGPFKNWWFSVRLLLTSEAERYGQTEWLRWDEAWIRQEDESFGGSGIVEDAYADVLRQAFILGLRGGLVAFKVDATVALPSATEAPDYFRVFLSNIEAFPKRALLSPPAERSSGSGAMVPPPQPIKTNLAFAATGAPLPQRFSVAALCISKRDQFTLGDPFCYARVFEGPLRGRTISLGISAESSEKVAQHPTRGLFFDPVVPTEIAPVPAVSLVVPLEMMRELNEAKTIAESKNRHSTELMKQRYPLLANGKPDWRKISVDYTPLFFYFDVEFPELLHGNQSAVIKNFRFETPERFPTRREVLSSPSGALPVRAQGFVGEAIYRLCRAFQWRKGYSALKQAMYRALYLPRTFEVEGIHSCENQHEWFVDNICRVRRVNVTAGPLSGTTLMLRIYNAFYIHGVPNTLRLPSPYGPGRGAPKEVAITEDRSERLKETGFRASRFGNPEGFGEVVVVLDSEAFKRLAEPRMENQRIKFTAHRSDRVFSTFAAVQDLSCEPLGHEGPTIFDPPRGEGERKEESPPMVQ